MSMNGSKPVDLIELARQAGVAEARELALQSRRDSVQLITFERNRDRDIPVGRHPQTNRVVFPDLKRMGGKIKPGETYFCDLIEYHPAAGPSVYYANPITKVDASYLFDLHPDCVEKLVEALMRGAPGQVLEQARAQIKSRLEQSAKIQVEALVTERDALRAENSGLRAELTKPRPAIQLVRSDYDVDSRESKSATPASSPKLSSKVNPPQISEQVPESTIERPTADELRSPLLREGRYFAHVSPDRQRLFIHAHPEGNLHVSASTLSVPGLSVLRPFDGEEQLNASPNHRVGGLAVDLSGRS
jgi:hypothetical protein